MQITNIRESFYKEISLLSHPRGPSQVVGNFVVAAAGFRSPPFSGFLKVRRAHI